jgi:gliding motility-associated-like protein
MTIRKFILLVLCVGLTYLVSPVRAFATHGAGGELFYEWVRDSTYRFYFRYYRDCSGATEESSQSLCYFNSCGTASGSITMSKMTTLPDGSPNGSEVNPGCPGYPTRCSGGTSGLPGYREWWYTGLYTLPSRCDYWTFYVIISNRNTSTNIGTGNLYVEATLNNRDGLPNRSPYFSVKPVPYVCVNNPYSFNNGAIDPDGDSLSFEFIQPRTANTCQSTYTATPVAYRSSAFNLSEPFATGNTFNFNTANGEMTFTPATQSTNTVSVRVSDWRNGIKRGSVMRDVQIQVLSCTNPPASVTPDPGSITGGQLTGGQVQGAANQLLTFCFNVDSDSPGRRLVVTDNHTLSAPGSNVVYVNQATSKVTGCLTWTPGCADTGLHILTVAVKDSTCLPPGIAVTRIFTIPVYIRTGSSTEKEVIVCRGAEVQLHASGGLQAEWTVRPGGSPLSSLSCTSCSSPVARPETTTVYEATSGSGSCYNTDRITVRVDNDNNDILVTPPERPYVLCEPGYAELSVSATGPRPLSNLSCGPAASSPSAPLDTVEIMPRNAAVHNVNNPVSTPFSGNYSVTARHQYLLRASDIRASGMYSGTLYGMAFRISSIGTGAMYDNLTVSLACTNLDEMSASAGFVPGITQVYAATGAVSIPPGGGYLDFNFLVPYNWDTTQNLIVDICYTNARPVSPAYTYFFSNTYQSTLYSYDTSGSICQSGGAQPVYSTHELPQIRFRYQPAPESEFSWRWGNALFEPSSIGSSVRAYIGETQKIWVHAYSRHGCLIGDTVDMYIPPPFRVLPENAEVCKGSALLLHAEHSVDTRWYESGFNLPTTLDCSQCDTPRAAPDADIVYTAVVRNDVGCTDTLFVPVRVKPVPEVHIVLPLTDTIVPYQAPVQLAAAGASHYVWTPSRFLDDAYVSDPVARPEAPTVFVVTGMLDGCFGYDSVHVDVDFRDRILIPSAFSPNGDGKNDVFRVANLSFQKIVEFRVFNRWGKEVFHAEAGATGGWDGTWNGDPQPMDTYKYIIRIAYPDGLMETYKGDITLVR